MGRQGTGLPSIRRKDGGRARPARLAAALALTAGLWASGAWAQAWPAAAERLALEPFAASPFPYGGEIPGQNKPFLDVSGHGGRGHTSPRGGVYLEEKTYSDRRSLLFIPKGFDPRRRFAVILYFHGNEALLQRDVTARQKVPQQVQRSGINAVLLAPQLAVDALDSSAGHFWDEGHLSRYLAEAAGKLAALAGDAGLRAAFDAAPVIVVAYSGGYLPAAFALERGGAGGRVAGVVLLDALYAETERFADFVAAHREAFFFSASSPSTRAENKELERLLRAKGLRPASGLPARLGPGAVAFLATPAGVTHQDFVTRAWIDNPLAAVLARVEAFAPPRGAKP